MRKKICSIIALVATLLITNIIQCAEKKISSHYRLKLHRISLTPPADSDLLNIIKSYVINPSSIKVNHLDHYYISENRVRASYETRTI